MQNRPIFKIAAFLAVVSLATAEYVDHRPYEGIDPNTLQCDPEGQVFLLLPDFHDCNKFYICAHGVEVPNHCSPGTIFDFELQGCAWPFNGKCILRTEEIEGSGEEASGYWGLEESEHYNIDPESEKAEAHADFVNILNCLRPSSAFKRVPYKGDCQRYWRCNEGRLEAVYCTDGLFFNAKTDQCDFEANAKCDPTLADELEGEYLVYNK